MRCGVVWWCISDPYITNISYVTHIINFKYSRLQLSCKANWVFVFKVTWSSICNHLPEEISRYFCTWNISLSRRISKVIMSVKGSMNNLKMKNHRSYGCDSSYVSCTIMSLNACYHEVSLRNLLCNLITVCCMDWMTWNFLQSDIPWSSTTDIALSRTVRYGSTSTSIRQSARLRKDLEGSERLNFWFTRNLRALRRKSPLYSTLH